MQPPTPNPPGIGAPPASGTGVAAPVRADAGQGAWRRERDAQPGRALPLPSDASLPFVIHAESHAVAVPTDWAPHAHPAHELIWVRNGTLTARVGTRIFTVSEGYGLWVPAGEPHSGRLTARVDLYDAFFTPELTPLAFNGPTVITMTPVLESLLNHLARKDLEAGERSRAESVVFDVLEPSTRQLCLRLPDDARVDPIAATILEDPADSRSLVDWARQLGLSPRTITRGFRDSTGLSFARWRQSVRVHRALAMLAEGYPVQDVSDLLGYAQPSTFIDAFRRVMGTTPGMFLRATSAAAAASGTITTAASATRR